MGRGGDGKEEGGPSEEMGGGLVGDRVAKGGGVGNGVGGGLRQ